MRRISVDSQPERSKPKPIVCFEKKPKLRRAKPVAKLKQVSSLFGKHETESVSMDYFKDYQEVSKLQDKLLDFYERRNEYIDKNWFGEI